MARARWLMLALGAGVVLAGTGAAYVYREAGLYGLNALIRRGPAFWVEVTADDLRLTPGMRAALRERPPPLKAGAIAWRTLEPGFAVGEMPVLDGEIEVSRVLLARIDPARFRFAVRAAPAGDRKLDDWLDDLQAKLVINGSYHTRHGVPETPVVAAGVQMGPTAYDAKHGMFRAAAEQAAVLDLRGADWRDAIRGASDALVSYPLLLAPDGSSGIKDETRWLADRSFVGQDGRGHIVFGTTTNGVFSLRRLADFLRSAPLDLRTVLNLDGGPVACQGVRVGDYRRDFCGRWELSMASGGPKLLQWPRMSQRWALPIVLAVLPR